MESIILEEVPMRKMLRLLSTAGGLIFINGGEEGELYYRLIGCTLKTVRGQKLSMYKHFWFFLLLLLTSIYTFHYLPMSTDYTPTIIRLAKREPKETSIRSIPYHSEISNSLCFAREISLVKLKKKPCQSRVQFVRSDLPINLLRLREILSMGCL